LAGINRLNVIPPSSQRVGELLLSLHLALLVAVYDGLTVRPLG